MTTTTEYQGHKTKGHWNICLYISNEEPLYRFAMECIREAKKSNPQRWLNVATTRFMASMSGERTPDGFAYTRERVRACLADLDE